MLATQIVRQSNSWKEFKNHLEQVTEKEKGDCFESLTKYYLQIHPTYATKLRNVWLLREVPRHVQERLRLPVADEGIDLIADIKEGGFWAIQCKYLSDESKSLNGRVLGTFTSLAFNTCKNIELALVCTTADRFSYKLKFYEDKLSLCYGDVWRSLDEEFFRRLHAHLDGKTIRPNPRQPRPHQQSAVTKANERKLRFESPFHKPEIVLCLQKPSQCFSMRGFHKLLCRSLLRLGEKTFLPAFLRTLPECKVKCRPPGGKANSSKAPPDGQEIVCSYYRSQSDQCRSTLLRFPGQKSRRE